MGITSKRDGVYIGPLGNTDCVSIQFVERNMARYYPLSVESPHEFLMYEAIRRQRDEVDVLHGHVVKVTDENALLKEENARLKQTIFGTSSEKSSDQQPDLASSVDSSPPSQEVPVQKPAKKARASGAGRKPLPAHLPRERIEYDLPSHDQFCPCCQGAIHRIGEEVTEQLTVIPAQFKVLQHARAKYVCRACGTFTTAPGNKPLIEKSSYASPDFLAHVACSKYQYGLPFYRQESIFEQTGLSFNRTTLANLMIGCSDKLSAVTELLRQHLLTQDVIHADETSVQVLKETDRRPQSKSYLWLYRSRQDADQPIVLFDYQMTRSGQHPRKFLGIDEIGAFSGHIQVDGYAGYNGLNGTVRVGCMAHVRRKFSDVIKLQPIGVTGGPANYADEVIGKLYGIERRIKGLDHHVRYKIRTEESVPILLEFKAWLDKMLPTVVPKSGLGKAIGYALDQWSAVTRFVEDGRLAIDNNIAEREIKAVVIGRKNWLFADSMDGMRANATMYSLVQTAKANNINPFDYLRYVFETIPLLKKSSQIECLLPWNMSR